MLSGARRELRLPDIGSQVVQGIQKRRPELLIEQETWRLPGRDEGDGFAQRSSAGVESTLPKSQPALSVNQLKEYDEIDGNTGEWQNKRLHQRGTTPF